MRDPSFDIYPICRHKSPRRNGRMEFPYGSSLHRCRSLQGTYFYMKIPMIATETVTAIGVCFVFLLLTLTYATTDRIWAKVWNCDVNVTASEEIPLSLGDIVSFLHEHKICATALTGDLTLHQHAIAQMMNRSSKKIRSIPSRPCCASRQPWQHSNYTAVFKKPRLMNQSKWWILNPVFNALFTAGGKFKALPY